MAWTWVTASSRGTSHIRSGTRCQDVSRCLVLGPTKSVLAAVVSDGAGSAQYGGPGAAIVCRSLVDAARIHFADSDALPEDALIWDWVDQARDRIAFIAAGRGTNSRQFAATLVAVFATNSETLIIHIGDGSTVLQVDGEWKSPSWPANGEFASTTYFVTDEPTPKLRTTRLAERASAVAVFSDGLERLALDFVAVGPHRPFFDGIFAPIVRTQGVGRNKHLSNSLRAYLGSAIVNDRTDDDKSLILAARP